MKGTVVGQIKQIGEVREVGDNNFRIKEILLKTLEENSNHYKIQFTSENTALLDDLKPNDIVKIRCTLRGREYQNDKTKNLDVFMSLSGWEISKDI